MSTMGRPWDPERAAPTVGGLPLPTGAYLLANEEALDGTPFAMDGGGAFGLGGIVLPLDMEIPSEIVGAASLVVLQADPASPQSLQRIVKLRAARPKLPIIVALSNADLTTTRSLIHQGVNDVVSIPFDFDQLRDALIEASVRANEEQTERPHLAPLITFLGGTGGCGATTMATHVAAEYGNHGGGKCCLIDLDVQFGAAGAYLGLSQQRSVLDLLEARERLDSDVISAVAGEQGDLLSVITAPAEILPLDQVKVDQALNMIDCARHSYGTIFLDLPANFTDWSLSAIMGSSLVVVVVELSVSGLRQARRRIDLLTEMGLDRRNVRIVVNRVERKLFKSIKSDDAEKVLKAEVIGSIVNEPGTVSSAQDQGKLVRQIEPRSAFARDITKLCESISAIKVDI